MFKSSRGSSIRPRGFVTLALAMAVLGLQAPAAWSRDQAQAQAPVDPDAARAEQVPDRSRRGRAGMAPPASGAQVAPQAAPQVAPPVARERGEARDRRDLRDRLEFRRQPGAVFAPSPRPPALPARGFEYRPRPDRIVPRVPPGYREYRWGGQPYYHYGARWYRPYGSSFLIVGAPFGLFVPYLPAYYTTFWYGGTRYFLADETYYLYDPVRRGYIVTRSPYGNDRDEDDEDGRDTVPSSAELFVYPMRGQSESQQAEDRYQCHRWAADQAHYDPTESEYRATERAEYDRAISACLTGRGYSVK